MTRNGDFVIQIEDAKGGGRGVTTAEDNLSSCLWAPAGGGARGVTGHVLTPSGRNEVLSAERGLTDAPGCPSGSREMRRSNKSTDGDEKARQDAIYQYLMVHRDEILEAAKERAQELIAQRDKQRPGPRVPK